MSGTFPSGRGTDNCISLWFYAFHNQFNSALKNYMPTNPELTHRNCICYLSKNADSNKSIGIYLHDTHLAVSIGSNIIKIDKTKQYNDFGWHHVVLNLTDTSIKCTVDNVQVSEIITEAGKWLNQNSINTDQITNVIYGAAVNSTGILHNPFNGYIHKPQMFYKNIDNILQLYTDTKPSSNIFDTLPEPKKNLVPYTKKGIGQILRPIGGALVRSSNMVNLGVSWYYYWYEMQVAGNETLNFVPALQDNYREYQNVTYDYPHDPSRQFIALLNEPDHQLMASSVAFLMKAHRDLTTHDISIQREANKRRWNAVFNKKKPYTAADIEPILVSKEDPRYNTSLWSRLIKKGTVVTSPVTARSPISNTNIWQPAFHTYITKDNNYDYLMLHWYGGTDYGKFIKFLKDVREEYKKDVFIKEFACQGTADSRRDPYKYSSTAVATFIRETVKFMEQTDWVVAYAWHDSYLGNCALIGHDGFTLTAAGKAYRDAPSAIITGGNPFIPKRYIMPNTGIHTTNADPVLSGVDLDNLGVDFG
jgi:hypothetical protein